MNYYLYIIWLVFWVFILSISGAKRDRVAQLKERNDKGYKRERNIQISCDYVFLVCAVVSFIFWKQICGFIAAIPPIKHIWTEFAKPGWTPLAVSLTILAAFPPTCILLMGLLMLISCSIFFLPLWSMKTVGHLIGTAITKMEEKKENKKG